MKKFFFIIALSILPLSITQADVRWFIGGGGGYVSTDITDINSGTETMVFGDANTVNAYFRGGLSINDYLDFGIELNRTLTSDETQNSTITATTNQSANIDLDTNIIFLYVKGNLPITDDFKLYGLIGFSDFELVRSNSSDTSLTENGTDSDDDIGYGFGFEYDFNNSLSLSADYIRYFNDNSFDSSIVGVTVDSLNIGVIYRF